MSASPFALIDAGADAKDTGHTAVLSTQFAAELGDSMPIRYDRS